MAYYEKSERRFFKLAKAFEVDGFRVIKKVSTESGKLGIAAEHLTVKNHDTGKRKTSYYLEGTAYERGYLLGLLAEEEISDMAVNFVDNIIFDFIGLEFLNFLPFLQSLLTTTIYELSQSTWISQPKHIHNEAYGLLDGCRKSNPNTRTTLPRLIIMNVGFDVLCALIYAGGPLRRVIPQITPEDIHLPMMCNAFSVFGKATGGEHFFIRDFMFATGNVLQNNLAHILHRPETDNHSYKLYPYVSVTAPGIIGSISIMNALGIAGGVNMAPAANCDPRNVGMNSLLLLRESIMQAESAVKAVRIIEDSQRGVTWNYVLSDGLKDTACTVEAGASWKKIDFLSYPSKSLLDYLPNSDYLISHQPVPIKKGVMVRWCNASFPESYMSFNPGLWHYYKKRYNSEIHLYSDAFSPNGYINRRFDEENCPSSLYFAPQRTGRDILITTNQFLMPHMRLCAMDPWISLLVLGNINDIQWRYDELNQQIRSTIFEQGRIDYSAAKQLAEFLAPYGNFPQYYKKNPRSKNGQSIRIEGCVSLFDLKTKTVESHYGYYENEWIKTTLTNYITTT